MTKTASTPSGTGFAVAPLPQPAERPRDGAQAAEPLRVTRLKADGSNMRVIKHMGFHIRVENSLYLRRQSLSETSHDDRLWAVIRSKKNPPQSTKTGASRYLVSRLKASTGGTPTSGVIVDDSEWLNTGPTHPAL